MLTNDEFRIWCQRNQISPKTETALARVRSSQPARKVQGGASNVSGRFPSVKMGFSIQFESHRVELWAIYAMEVDDDVLQYYDQPTRIQLHYHARSGRKSSPWHTPDFLVIRKTGVAFEEWKPEDALEKLASRIPDRYQPTGAGGWRSPPGEQAAQELGFAYRVRSSKEYHPFFIQNLKILRDFWIHPFPLPPQAQARVQDALKVYPGISVAAILSAMPDLTVDMLWTMLTLQQVYTDLSAASLMHWEHVFLYRSAQEAETAKQTTVPQAHRRSLFASPLIFDGRLWEA